MRRIARMAVAVLCSFGTLSTGSCMVMSGPTSPPSFNYTIQGGTPATGYSSSGTGYSSNSYGSSSTSGSYASSGTNAGSGSSASALAGYSKDTSQSDALTNYLQRNRLPLVGAQVLANNQGAREIILYGFVATDFGKRDAVAKARRYLNDPRARVDNRIAVRPELLASGSNGSSSSAGSTYDPNAAASSGNALGSVRSYENQAQTQQYLAQQNNAINMLLPLIGMMGLFSLGNSGAAMGYSGFPPSYGSPYSTPYGSPYSPYTTPYPPSYGYPRGFSPYP